MAMAQDGDVAITMDTSQCRKNRPPQLLTYGCLRVTLTEPGHEGKKYVINGSEAIADW